MPRSLKISSTDSEPGAEGSAEAEEFKLLVETVEGSLLERSAREPCPERTSSEVAAMGSFLELTSFEVAATGDFLELTSFEVAATVVLLPERTL